MLRPGPGRWGAVVFVAAFVLLVAAGIGYTNWVRHESDARWCSLLELLTAGPAPETEQGRAVLTELRRLESEFDC